MWCDIPRTCPAVLPSGCVSWLSPQQQVTAPCPHSHPHVAAALVGVRGHRPRPCLCLTDELASCRCCPAARVWGGEALRSPGRFPAGSFLPVAASFSLWCVPKLRSISVDEIQCQYFSFTYHGFSVSSKKLSAHHRVFTCFLLEVLVFAFRLKTAFHVEPIF